MEKVEVQNVFNSSPWCVFQFEGSLKVTYSNLEQFSDWEILKLYCRSTTNKSMNENRLRRGKRLNFTVVWLVSPSSYCEWAMKTEHFLVAFMCNRKINVGVIWRTWPACLIADPLVFGFVIDNKSFPLAIDSQERSNPISRSRYRFSPDLEKPYRVWTPQRSEPLRSARHRRIVF